MIGSDDNEPDTVQLYFEFLADVIGQSSGATCKRLQSNGPESDHNTRSDRFQLGHEIGQALAYLLVGRLPVPRRAASDDVGDEYAGPIDPEVRKHRIEEFPCSPHERYASNILLLPGSLADEHEFRVFWPDPVDYPCPAIREVTSEAFLDRRITVSRSYQLFRFEQRYHLQAVPLEQLPSALLPVDDRNHLPHGGALCSQCLDDPESGCARGGYILYH
jgi:hypothetical protein